ncbi:MAG: hypothetical protein ACOCVU_04760 [Desulfohalobiaceae bacterium]
MSLGDLLALEPGAADRFQELWLGYTESLGAPALRGAIASLHEGITPRAGPGARRGAVDAFCADLVTRAGVLLLPGTLYEEGSNAFRIGFGRRTMPKALPKLESYLQDNR